MIGHPIAMVLDGSAVKLSLSFWDVPFFIMSIVFLFFDFFWGNTGEYEFFIWFLLFVV